MLFFGFNSSSSDEDNEPTSSWCRVRDPKSSSSTDFPFPRADTPEVFFTSFDDDPATGTACAAGVEALLLDAGVAVGAGLAGVFLRNIALAKHQVLWRICATL